MEESLYGVIAKVTYYNEDTHFGVVKVKLDYQDHRIAKYKAKLFTNILNVTGSFERQPIVDEQYDFVGEFVTNQYGIQFKATRCQARNDNTLEGVITFLSSDLFPGVGKVTAQKIFHALGEDCLSKIEQEQNVLNEIEGITAHQKQTIYGNLVDFQKNKQTLVGLLDLGMTMRTATKIMRFLGNDALEKVRTNPYMLIEMIEGFGFRRADKIALEVGFAKDSALRLQALFLFLIRQICFSYGDTFVEMNFLYQKAAEELNKEEEILSTNNFHDNLDALVDEHQIIIDEQKNIFDLRLYNSEILLAQRIHTFLNNVNQYQYSDLDIQKAMTDVSIQNKIEYGEKQQDAIIMALKEPLCIITGGPGTGKSTIIKGIIDCLLRLYPNEIIREKIALLAPTGRASKRLRELTGYPAMTIHKFLGYEGHGFYRFGPLAKVDAKILIVDEVSMVDLGLAARLFGAVDDDVKVILVGDVDQLPSVGPGDVLNDLISCKEISTVRLTKIHRQAEDSSIVALAHQINAGVVPESVMDRQPDRNFINMQDIDLIPNILKTVEQALNKGMDLIRDIQVLVPMYKGEVGINAINLKMQEKFNPSNGHELKHMNRVFRVNDKVIQLVNRSEKKVMNGDIGYVLSLDYSNGEYQGLTVMFDFGSVDYTRDELEDLTHAFAISIHKSQGSEFDCAIVPFSYRYFVMLKRKLIYTAITRAKKYLIMMGSIEAFIHGIAGIEPKRRTKLQERITANLQLTVPIEQLEISEMEEITPYDFMK
ncbi:MAG: ATP-dependent RecD-like DNA helicase [Bacilli bacterium]